MENIDDIQLGLVKFRANADRYFSLFDKHIPRYNNDGKNKKFLLLGICNESVILKMCALNKAAKYYIIDQEILQQTLPILDENIDFEIFDSDLDMYDIIKGLDMKFDCVIMNPPYDKSLHLKILSEAIKHLKDNDSKVINLSPVRWLQDPVAKYKKICDYKKYEKLISLHLNDIEIISKCNANKLFLGAGITTDLGIYTVLKNNGNFNYKKLNTNSIVDKVLSIMKYSIADIIENNKLDGWRVRVNELQPIEASDARDSSTQKWRHFIINPHTETYVYKDGYTEKTHIFWSELVQKGKYTKNIGSPLPFSIKFNTSNEAYNFEESCKTNFMNALKNIIQQNAHVPLFALPFMEDYTEPWTDERFYKFFNITKEEQKIIEDTMAKYK